MDAPAGLLTQLVERDFFGRRDAALEVGGRRVEARMLDGERLDEAISAVRSSDPAWPPRGVADSAELCGPAGSGGNRVYVLVWTGRESMSLLRDWMRARERIELREALAVLREVARGMGNLHARGIVHGNLSPESVRLDATDCPRVELFGYGLRQEAPPRAASASTWYTPAESFRPEPADARASDTFAWGCLLVELLTGVAPHAASKPGDDRYLSLVGGTPFDEATLSSLDAMDARLRPLAEACLDADPQRRPRAEALPTLLALLLPEAPAGGEEPEGPEERRLPLEEPPPLPGAAGSGEKREAVEGPAGVAEVDLTGDWSDDDGDHEGCEARLIASSGPSGPQRGARQRASAPCDHGLELGAARVELAEPLRGRRAGVVLAWRRRDEPEESDEEAGPESGADMRLGEPFAWLAPAARASAAAPRGLPHAHGVRAPPRGPPAAPRQRAGGWRRVTLLAGELLPRGAWAGAAQADRHVARCLLLDEASGAAVMEGARGATLFRYLHAEPLTAADRIEAARAVLAGAIAVRAHALSAAPSPSEAVLALRRWYRAFDPYHITVQDEFTVRVPSLIGFLGPEPAGADVAPALRYAVACEEDGGGAGSGAWEGALAALDRAVVCTWALVASFLLSGREPFAGLHPLHAAALLVAGERPAEFLEGLSFDADRDERGDELREACARLVISKAWTPDPRQRPSLHSAFRFFCSTCMGSQATKPQPQPGPSPAEPSLKLG
eukprot:tig00021612_g22899.t1